MTSTISSAPNPANAALTASAASSSASGTTSPSGAVPAQPTARSTYANAATKNRNSPPAIASSNPPVAVGGTAPAQYGKPNPISPVNGKNVVLPAVPTVAAPAIVNSSSIANGVPPHDHSRKPSSMMISAAGASGYMPNGGPVGQASRPNINFGSMNSGPSPAPAHAIPHQSQQTSLPMPFSNPRVTSPAASPSPIPQPAASGGRPPSSLQNQGNGLTFGGMGGDNSDQSLRPGSLPQGPATPGVQPAHLRRESSQSTHSDISAASMNNLNRPFVPNANSSRGRGYGQAYGGPMAHSPGPNFRPMNQQRGGPNMPPQFQNQGQMPNSPYRATRSPALPPAAMAQQAHLANGPPMAHGAYGYPQHLQPQPVKQPSSSRNPASDSDKSLQPTPQATAGPASAKPQFLTAHESNSSRSFPTPDLSPSSGGFDQYLTMLKSQGHYGVPPYDPSYGGYYSVPQYMHPMQFPGAPPSPRPFNHTPHGPQQQYMHGQYGNPVQSQGMSRTSSQVSERPPSTLAQPQTPSVSSATHPPHTPSQNSSSPAPPPATSQFTIPARNKSKAIQIKNPDGEVLNFDTKKSTSPAPSVVQSKAPVVVSSTPTPPPRTPSTGPPNHTRSESKLAKTDEEVKHDFQEQVKKQIEADRAEEKRKQEEEEQRLAKEKEEAEAKAAKEKEEEEARAAKEKEEAERAQAEAQKAKEAAEQAEKAKREQEEKERLQREEDERLEREIAEMEERERQEEERERAYQEKKKKEAEERAQREAEAKANADEEMRRAEREAEEAEEARQKQKPTEEESPEEKAERERLFASLKRPTLGPGATASESGTSTPVSDISMPPPAQPRATSVAKPKPTALKLDTNKTVEPAQPTAGMQALKSARFLDVRNEAINYPPGIQSPNPALNQGGKSRGRQYDKSFLLQFQQVFTEKPSPDWDNRVKETLGDSSDSARPQSARTPSSIGVRQGSRPAMPSNLTGGPMGNFNQAGRTLPPGTTSDQRFIASTQAPRGAPMSNPFAPFATGRPGGFPVGGPAMVRTGSSQSLAQGSGFNSPRVPTSRGKNSRRGDRANAAEEAKKAQIMPLTAGMDLKPLEMSKSGWKPMSITGAPQQVMPGGHLPPDIVQRKVKAALNKMTPEKFEKISNDILEIAGQSKDENDGRTLRQVIQLTFEKATDEAHWASMYAKFCKRMLETMSPEIKDENVRDKAGNPVVGGALFRKYLLNRCQEEFERGWEVNLPERPEGQTEEAAMLSDEYYIAAAAKRRGLGLVQFIGELYKLGMLTVRIMHECVVKLLNFEGLPDESAVESLVKLLRTVGATMDSTEQGHTLIMQYFDRINNIMKMEGLPSRLHFMLLDVVDLRKAGWRSKDDQKGPKTITEIHQEAQAAQQQAELERARQSSQRGPRPQMGRGDVRSFSGGGMMPPPDYPRNQVATDDLRKLAKNVSNRNVSQGPATLGPSSSMFAGRSSSGRKGPGLGGALSRGGEESGASSRTATPPVKDNKDSTAHANTFSALAALDGSGEGADDIHSPPATEASSPPLSKAKPADAATESQASAGEEKAAESAEGAEAGQS